MIKHGFHIALVLIFLVSCKPKNNDIVDDEDLIEVEQDVTISSIGISLNPKAKKELNSWFEYHMVKSKIEGYNKITVSQALENAKDLSGLVKKIADSVKIEIINRPDVLIRFNVLYNHTLRLDDMSTITSITDEEVKEEVTKILDAFSAVNDKINVIYTIESYEKEFDIQPNEKVEFIDRKTLPNKPPSKEPRVL